jgi:hypothetical protein
VTESGGTGLSAGAEAGSALEPGSDPGDGTGADVTRFLIVLIVSVGLILVLVAAAHPSGVDCGGG